MADESDVFDVIVIGAGPVGLQAAERVVRGGLTAALVENRLAGGERHFYACVPLNALLRPGDLAAEVSRMPGLGPRGPLDAAAVLARRDGPISHDDRLRGIETFAGELLAKSFQASGIDVRLGRSPARVQRPVPGGPVTVHTDDGSQIEADEILVGTGRRAAVGDIGLDTAGLEANGTIDVDASMRATGVPGGWLYA